MSEAFEHQDARVHRSSLGIAFCGGVYELEARGYSYPKPGKPDHSQVVARGSVFSDAVEAIALAARSASLALGPRPVWSLSLIHI